MQTISKADEQMRCVALLYIYVLFATVFTGATMTTAAAMNAS